MAPHEILLPFRDGVRAQPDAVSQTAARASDWLAEHRDVLGPGTTSALLLGIGASHAVLAAPVAALRGAGVLAVRSTGEDLAAGTTLPFDLAVAVSQSGRSPETVAALDVVDPGHRLAVVNQPASPLAAAAGRTWWLGGLVDSGMSSVAVAATAVALGMLAERRVEGAPTPVWRRLPELLDGVLEDRGTRTAVEDFAARAATAGCIDVAGRPRSVGAAEQGALLLREGPKVASLGTGTRTYLHGLTDAVGRTAHVLVGGAREAALADQLAAYGVPVLLVTDEQARPGAGVHVAQLPQLPPLAAVVTEVAVLQLLALALGETLGTDVDAGTLARVDTKLPETGGPRAEADR
jgi:glucosamine--fructose-6-phosphate aminotransferase (isomerizing)